MDLRRSAPDDAGKSAGSTADDERQETVIGVPNPPRPGSEMVKAHVILLRRYRSAGDEEALKADSAGYAGKHPPPYEAPGQFENFF